MTENSKLKHIIVDGKELPFTCGEFIKILKVIRKNFVKAEENLDREDEIKYLDELLQSLDKQ